MKLLLLGADGQVGFELRRSLMPLGEVRALGRAEADLADAKHIRALVQRESPDWIVNAAAYTAVDQAEDEPERAMAVNGAALAAIGEAARAAGARVLHYSTDYVFDGETARARDETSPVAPLGAYGRSKLAGEQALAASGAPFLVFRTAWIYAARGRNFLRTMLKLAAERDMLRVVADQHGSPTSARLVAECSALALFSLRGAAADDPRFGIHHLAAGGATTWHGFASALLAGAHAIGLLQRLPEVVPITTAEFPTKARRPRHSVLDCRRFEQAFGLVLPDWRVPMMHVLHELKDSLPR